MVFLILSKIYRHCRSAPHPLDFVSGSKLRNHARVILQKQHRIQIVHFAAVIHVANRGIQSIVTHDTGVILQHQHGIQIVHLTAVIRITLEVRFSNDPAIALYQKFGFEEVGRRKNYFKKISCGY